MVFFYAYIFLSPILPFIVSTCKTSISTDSHTFTTSSTFVTLSLESFDICIIPDFHLNSTIAHTQSIILTIFQVSLSHTLGSQSIALISSIAFSHPSCVGAVRVVVPSSAIETFTQYSFSILCTFSPHLPIITLILSSGTFIVSISGAYLDNLSATFG
jgi:hypothetical protein